MTPGEVLVEGERIRAVGSHVDRPANAELIDLGDTTLLPGLIDVHIHLFLHPGAEDLQTVEESVPWRTLIAAELVFGVSSGKGGLGWFIFENKNMLDIPNVFAGLLTVILIGLVVENLIFQTIERRTLQRWGMQA